MGKTDRRATLADFKKAQAKFDRLLAFQEALEPLSHDDLDMSEEAFEKFSTGVDEAVEAAYLEGHEIGKQLIKQTK